MIYFHDRHRFIFLIIVLVQRIGQLLQVDLCLEIAQMFCTWTYICLCFLLRCFQTQCCPVISPPSSNQMVARFDVVTYEHLLYLVYSFIVVLG